MGADGLVSQLYRAKVAWAFRLDARAHRNGGRFDSARLCEECALAVEQGNHWPLSTSMRGIERDPIPFGDDRQLSQKPPDGSDRKPS